MLQKYPTAYIFRADIKKAFEYINHATLLNLLQQKLPTHPDGDFYLKLCHEVIASFCANTATTATDPVAPPRGIPIGNLTSQIFSLIYLNELDRFIRQVIKPLAYLRYGDDFIVFLPTRPQADAAQAQITDFLAQGLKMSLNPKNTIIIKAGQGLHFLGHLITKNTLKVDRTTTAKIRQKVNFRNLASYKQLLLPTEVKDALDHQVLAQITSEITKTLDF